MQWRKSQSMKIMRMNNLRERIKSPITVHRLRLHICTQMRAMTSQVVPQTPTPAPPHRPSVLISRRLSHHTSTNSSSSNHQPPTRSRTPSSSYRTVPRSTTVSTLSLTPQGVFNPWSVSISRRVPPCRVSQISRASTVSQKRTSHTLI